MPQSHLTRPIGQVAPKYLNLFWLKIDKTPGHGPWGDCWLWTASTNASGYGIFGIGRTVTAHRLSYVLRKGETEDLVLHRCHVRRCVNPDHLYHGSNADNMRDMAAAGRSAKQPGERNPNAKITDAEREEIRDLFSSGRYFEREIGEMYSLGQTQVSRIVADLDVPRYVKRRVAVCVTGPEQRREICRLYATGQFEQKELARMFDITQGRVSQIVRLWPSQAGGAISIVSSGEAEASDPSELSSSS